MTDPNLAVVVHLIRMIQDSPDVRYHVGGAHTTMRELLVKAIIANGYTGNPLDVLRPAAHHANEQARVQRLGERAELLERLLERACEALGRLDETAQEIRKEAGL